MEKLKIPYPVIVEGKYDRLRLLSVMEGQIFTTDGFGIFKRHEKAALLRALAAKTPVVVLTDPDGAGKLIRAALTSWLPKERVIHLYVPRVDGKEKRKEKPSAEGVLGVEGMENDLLLALLAPYADGGRAKRLCENPLSKTDFYIDGLTGGEGSTQRRDAFAQRLGLPAGMTPNALLAAVRVLCSYEEYLALVGRKTETEGGDTNEGRDH